MKKLLIFMLVLGLASVANATTVSGVELSVNGVTDGPGNVTEIEVEICEEVVIDVYGPAGYDWVGYVFIASDWPGAGGEWGDELGPPYEPMCSGYYYEKEGYPIVHPEAGDPDLSGAIRFEYQGFGFGYEVSGNSATSVPGGKEFEFMYHCCGPWCTYVTINLWDAADLSGPQDTIVVHQVPEPATIALLGLGGLFLRRRKY